jgi:putative oxidoreductase
MLPLQNEGEPAALFSWAFLLLVFTGSGALALDQVIGNRRSSGQPAVEVATAA